MNELERAVIAAARRVVNAPEDLTGSDELFALTGALAALDAEDLPAEVLWSLVAEGDQVQSIKNKRFYPVIANKLMPGGKHKIVLANGADFVRPTPAEPRAIVKRGATGKAIDTWGDVIGTVET